MNSTRAIDLSKPALPDLIKSSRNIVFFSPDDFYLNCSRKINAKVAVIDLNNDPPPNSVINEIWKLVKKLGIKNVILFNTANCDYALHEANLNKICVIANSQEDAFTKADNTVDRLKRLAFDHAG